MWPAQKAAVITPNINISTLPRDLCMVNNHSWQQMVFTCGYYSAMQSEVRQLQELPQSAQATQKWPQSLSTIK